MSFPGLTELNPHDFDRLSTRLQKRIRHTVLSMKLDSSEADLLFSALGNKTRRLMLQRLAKKPARSISELAQEFGISNTAASNHVALLERAGLIERIQRGKYHQIRMNTSELLLRGFSFK